MTSNIFVQRYEAFTQWIHKEFALEVPYNVGNWSKSPRWSNEELDPTPVEKQTWGTSDYWAYWCSYLLASPLVSTVSAVMSLGFTARETVPIVFCGFFLCSIIVTLTAKIGATYHIPYPVLVRAPFGMLGSYPAIFIRAIIGMMWTALLCVTASGFLRHCIAAIWPGFENLPNHLPPSAGIDSVGLLCFFLWWIMQTCLCLMPNPKLRLLFKAKAYIVPPTFFALFLWAVIVTRGGGQLVTGRTQLTTNMGPVYSALSGVNVILGLFSTMALNIPAFGRLSKNRMTGGHHFLALPVIGTLGALTPIFITSAHQQLRGDYEWYTPKIVGKFENRPAKFVVGASLMLATVGNQIAAGSKPFSNDISGLAPRYVNTFRGTIVAAVLCVVLTPWKIVHNAAGLRAFLNGYSCLMGPLAGILISDFYLVRRGRLDFRELYKEGGIYWYASGFNWRAFFAFACGVTPMIPGLVQSIWTKVEIYGAWKLYSVAWSISFLSSGLSYWAVCYVWPPTESLIDDAVYPPHVGDELGKMKKDDAFEFQSVPNKLLATVHEVIITAVPRSHLR